MRVKEESEKAGFKFNIRKTMVMVSSPITSWQVETVTDFISLGSKITADGDHSREIKTLALWKKNYDKPKQHVKKQRHYFANKSPSSQTYGFSCSHIWVWELDHKESWARRIDAFKLWCWRRLVRVPWTAGKSNQSILKEVSPSWCRSWNSNTLATWSKELNCWKRPWCWERLKAGEEGDDRGWDGWMASLIQWIWVWA